MTELWQVNLQELEVNLTRAMEEYGSEGYCPLAALCIHKGLLPPHGYSKFIGWNVAVRLLDMPLPIVNSITAGFDGALIDDNCYSRGGVSKAAFELGRKLKAKYAK